MHLLICLGLVAAIFAVYAQVGGHDYLNLDDDVYILKNPQVRGGISLDSVTWAFTQAYEAYWLPLTWISFMLDMELWGLDAGAQLLTNVAMHATGTVLLYLVLYTLTGSVWPSAWVAAVFALHPVHVESVAWVSQRKDVLSTIFWMLTTLAYVHYTHLPSPRRYTAVITAFAIGLLSKTTLVTLPAVLLLLDAWPLARKDRTPLGLIVEKLPLFAVASVAALITFLTQTGAGAVQDLSQMPLLDRLANVCVGYVTYIGMMLWPSNLAIFYPLAPVETALALAAALVLLAATATAIAFLVRAPYLTVGWFWFALVLVPVIGFVQVGGQAMADRWLHIASIGLTIAVAWSAMQLTEGRPAARRALGVLALATVVTMPILSYRQLGYWRDSITMFTRTISVTENNFLAHNNLGQALAAAGRTEESGRHYAEAVRIHPNYPPARNNLGTYLANQGKLDEAAPHFEAALAINPNLSAAQNNLATIYARTGRPELAIAQYRRAIAADTNNADAHFGLGDVLMMVGRPAEAAVAYAEALRLAPGWAPAEAGLARARSAAGG